MNYLVLADIHANRPALEAVLSVETDWDRLLFLGDAVDYGPHPRAVLDRLEAIPGEFVIGNHDRSMLEGSAAGVPDGRKGFTGWTRSQLDPTHVAFLEGFERSTTVESASGTVRVHHGDFGTAFGDCSLDRRLTPQTSVEMFDRVGRRFDEGIVLFGHSHRSFDLRVNGTRFLNPGSVGRSTPDGPGANYACLEDGEFRLESCTYDATRTIADMETLPIDEEPTIWRRCLKRELFRLRMTCGTVPDERDVGTYSRYEPVAFDEEFGSLERALRGVGLRPS